MSIAIQRRNERIIALFVAGLAALLVIALLSLVATSQADGSPTAPPTLDVGYLDFTYGATVRNVPTAFDPESKLWWADGFWWGSMWNDTAGQYNIYRLNWGTQSWEDTGVPLDDRSESRADARFDAANNKLYIASHFTQDSPGPAGTQESWGRVYRYSYHTISNTYTLDSNFPVTVNEDKTATMVLEKDNTGRLWTTYVSKPQGTDDFQVYVNATTRAGLNRDHRWSTPFSLGDSFPAAHLSSSDIASVVNIGDELAVVWTNQISGTLNFAIHGTGSAIESDWTHYPVTLPFPIDNHINVKSLESGNSGQIFAATKLQSTPAMTDTDPLIGMVTRDTNGSFSWHTYSTLGDRDTRPLAMIDAENNNIYIFVSGKAGGGKLCYKSATITSPLSNIQFAEGNCGTTFIDDSVYDNFNSATSSKQNVNNTSGIAVLASDDMNGDFYAHNVTGDPPPVVTSVIPEPGAIEVSTAATIKATFSKNMNASTLNAGTFTVVGPSGAAAGTITYDSVSRTATFTPTSLLEANSLYKVTLTTAIQDTSGKGLFSQESWSFSTDRPTVQFETPTYSANEAGGSATITVTLDSASGSGVTVEYATSDGTAIEPGDYTAISGTLTFPAGSTSQTFAVNIANDTTDEDNETVNLALSNANDAQLGLGGDTATLTIVDDEGAPSVQFNPTSVSANEGDGTATVDVTLSHASAFAISAGYAAGGGTASDGSDYTATNGTLNFAAGVTSQSFSVSILEDDIDELNETVMLTLTNPISAVLGIPDDKATLTIVDNDQPPAVQFDNSAYSTAESGSATITVTLSSVSGITVTVDYATSLATATPGADYTAISGTLTFAPGDTSETFAVAILPDTLDEAHETVNLTLSDPTNTTPGTPVNAVLTILDDDLPPTIQFGSATYDHVEDSGAAAITVTLSAPSGQTVAVNYATSDGTATAPADYTATSATLEIAAGEMSGIINLPIVADLSDEFDETVNLSLSDPDDATLGSLTNAVLTIIDDDDVPEVRFSEAAPTVNEAAGTATISVTLTAPSANVVTVAYASSDGSATAGSDYVAVSDTLIFTPGTAEMSFEVPLIDDSLDEANETVHLALSAPTFAVLGTPSASTLIIVDDDGPPTVQFSSASYSANEGDGTATIQVTLSSVSGQSVSVSYATSDGTATTGVDFTDTNGVLVFPPGTTNNSFSVPIEDDALDEPDEIVNLALSGPINAGLGIPDKATLTIADNDAPVTVQFSDSIYAVAESDGTAVVTVTLSAPSGFIVTVELTATGGSATSGVDYTLPPGLITFAPGTTVQSAAIGIVSDSDNEFLESALLTLDKLMNVAAGSPDSANLTISDDDGGMLALPLIMK